MCNDLGEGSRCCAGYSFIGALFTVSLEWRPTLRQGCSGADRSIEQRVDVPARWLESEIRTFCVDDMDIKPWTNPVGLVSLGSLSCQSVASSPGTPRFD